MGNTILEDQEDYYQLAKSILLDIGEISYICQIHKQEFEDNYKYDMKELYAIATERVKKLYGNNNIDFIMFHEGIKRVMDDATADSCYYCDKLEKE